MKKKTAKAPRPVRSSPGGATYLYALVQGPRPALEGMPRGLPDAGAPRLLDAGGGLWLVAATVPLAAYDGPEIERRLQDLAWVSSCAVGHEEVVELMGRAVGRGTTVLPMKLFTLFRDDARALEHVGAARQRLEAVCDRVKGSLEWGVRIGFDARKASASPAKSSKKPARGAGTAFLERKKEARDARLELATRARARTDEAHASLAKLARDARRHAPVPGEPGARLLLDAAYLVPVSKRARFEGAAAKLARELSPEGYDVVLTGPWPPYNFVGEARP
jgi:hypothetical protein